MGNESKTNNLIGNHVQKKNFYHNNGEEKEQKETDTSSLKPKLLQVGDDGFRLGSLKKG